ncbi:MAG: Ig-like domain-containing protein [Bacillota bacterium]
MKRIKPKWLLGAMIVALAVAAGPLVAEAEAPVLGAIVSPTDSQPAAVASGNNVWVEFTYTSVPSAGKSNTTSATIEVTDDAGIVYGTRAYAYPTIKDTNDPTVEDYDPLLPDVQFIGNVTVTAPNGLYNVRVTVTNGDGSDSDVNYDSVLVDNSLPSAVSGLAVSEDFDGDGVPGNAEVDATPDGYLKDTTPTFTWTAATDNGNPPSGIAKYWIQIDGKFTWREVAGTTYTVPGVDALADGAYIARVKAEDKAGNVGPEATIDFTVDTAAPSAPTLDAEPTYTKGTSNTITWPAVTDPVTSTCEYYAEYSDDNFASPPLGNSGWIGATSWTVSGLTSGTTYYYRAKARDLAGNESGWSTVQSSTQDDAAPVFNTLTYTPAVGSWSNVPSLTVSVEVTDALAGINTSAFVFTVDGNPPDAGTQAYHGGTGVLSGTFSGLTTGTHTVYVKAFDNADAGGNWAETTWTFGVDLEGPVISSTQPHGWITNSSPTVSADYNAGPSGLDTSVNTVRLRRSDYTGPGTPAGADHDGSWTATGGPEYLSGTLSYAPGALTDGKWNVGLDAKDRAGNTLSAGWFFNIDTTPPGAPGLASTTTPTNNTTPDWTWTASTGDPNAPDGTAGSGLDHYEVKIGTTAGGDDILAATNVGNVTTWTTDLDPSTPGNQGFADDGTYFISVRAVDALGNASNWVGDATTKVVVDTVAPTLGGNVPTGFINNASPTLEVGFDDTVGATVVSGYGSTTSFTLDSVTQLPLTIPPDSEPGSGAGTGSIKKVTSDLSEGSHTVSITVRDAAGNTTTLGTLESPWTFFVDTVHPIRPASVTVASPTNDPRPTFSWTGATDLAPSSGIDDYTVEIWTTGGAPVKVKGPYTVDHTSDPHSLELPPGDAFAANGSQDGTYEVRVWTNDAADNTSDDYRSTTFVLDTQRPSLSNGSPTGYIATDTPTISADFADVGVGLDASETTLTLTYDGSSTEITSGFTGSDGDLSVTIQYMPTSPLDDGAYTADMVAYDLAGNKSTPDLTLQWTFNIDTTPPTDPGSPVAGNAHDSNGKWYINTLRPTFSWTASADRKAPDGTDGSGLSHYWFQFGLKAEKDVLPDDTWATALVDESGGNPGSTPGTGYIAPTPGVAIQQWTPSSDLPLEANREYSARVKAFDEVGNHTSWVDPPIIYDPDPPTVPGVPSTTSPTNDATPVWTWTGSTDAISGVDLYHIQIRRQGNSDWDVLDTTLDVPDFLGDPLDPDDQVWEQGQQLESGTYEIRVRAMDVAGNYSKWCDDPSVIGGGVGTVVVDVDRPTAPIMAAEPEFTGGLQNTVSWGTSSDIGSGVARYEIRMVADLREALEGAAVENMGLATARTYGAAPDPPLVDGKTYYYQVRAVDAVGNASDWSEIVFSTQDNTPPDMPEGLVVVTPPTDDTPMVVWNAVNDRGSGVAFYVLTITPQAGGGTLTEYPSEAQWTALAPLADGEYTVQVYAVDRVSNAGLPSASVSFVIDTAAPDVPEMDDDDTYTSGTSNEVSWSDESESGAVAYCVEYSDNEDFLPPLGSSGWISTTSFTFEGLTEGTTYFYHVKAKDAVGNESDWSGWISSTQVTAVLPPPSIEELPVYSTDNDVTLTWTSVEDAVGYRLYKRTEAGAWTAAWEGADVTTTVSDLGEGKWYFRVCAYNELNEEGTFSEVVFTTVDTVAPDEPEADTLPPYTGGTSVALHWRPSDDETSGVARYVIECYEGDDLWATGTAGPEATTYEFSGLSIGSTYEFQIRVVDNAGNESSAVSFGTTTLEHSALCPPVINEVADYTKGLEITVSWTPVQGATTYVFQYSTREDFDPEYTVDVTRLTEAQATVEVEFEYQYWFRVMAYNDVTSSEWSAYEYTTFDDTAPAMPETLVRVTPMNDPYPTFHWSQAFDAGSGAYAYVVGIDEDDSEYPLIGATTWTWPQEEDPLGTGTHTLRMVCIDKVGNVNFPAYEFEFEIDVDGPNAPGLTPLPPYTPGTSLSLQWTVPDDVGPAGVAGFIAQSSLDAGFSQVVSEIRVVLSEPEAEVAGCEFRGLTPGTTYYYRVMAFDAAGNPSEWSHPVGCSTQDPVPLPAPVMAAEPVFGFTSGLSNTVYWGPVAGADKYLVQRSIDSTFESYTLEVEVVEGEGGLPEECTFEDLVDGTTYYYRVRAIDTDASTPIASEWSNIVSSTQDNTAPRQVVGLTRCDDQASDNIPAFQWTPGEDPAPGEAGLASGVARYRLQHKLSTAAWPSDASGEIVTGTTWTAPGAWVDGQHNIRVRAIDVVGNEGPWSEPLTITIDTTPPVITFINPTHGGEFNITTSSTIIAEITGEPDWDEVWLWVDGTKVAPTAIVGNIVYHVVGVPFAAGDHTVKIRAKDAAGNAASAEITFTVENYREGFGFGRLRFPEPPPEGD